MHVGIGSGGGLVGGSLNQGVAAIRQYRWPVGGAFAPRIITSNRKMPSPTSGFQVFESSWHSIRDGPVTLHGECANPGFGFYLLPIVDHNSLTMTAACSSINCLRRSHTAHVMEIIQKGTPKTVPKPKRKQGHDYRSAADHRMNDRGDPSALDREVKRRQGNGDEVNTED